MRIATGQPHRPCSFVVLLLVLLSNVVGLRPVDLRIRPGLVFSVFISAWIATQAAIDAESDCYKAGATADHPGDSRLSILLSPIAGSAAGMGLPGQFCTPIHSRVLPQISHVIAMAIFLKLGYWIIGKCGRCGSGLRAFPHYICRATRYE